MTRRAGSPPPSSIQHRDRMRTLVSWAQTHDDTTSGPNAELGTTGGGGGGGAGVEESGVEVEGGSNKTGTPKKTATS